MKTSHSSTVVRAGIGAVIILAGWAVYSRMIQPSSSANQGPDAAGSGTSQSGPDGDESRPDSTPPDPDEQLRRLAIGTWEDEYQGKRTMTLNADGTATMVVELSGLKATLFASRLRFNMLWSVEEGRLKKRTIGGKPSTQVQLILKTMGDRVDEPILELTEDRLLLQDQNGETKYDWRRVGTTPQ